MTQAIQELIDNLKNDNWQIRKDAINSLVVYPEDSYLPILGKWLRNGDNALLRNSAMEMYRALGNRALESLFSFIKDQDSDVRIFAINLLGDIKDKSSVPWLISALRDDNVNVRFAAAESLGRIGDETAIDALAEAMDDLPWVTIACIGAIGEIGGDKALSILHNCLEREEYRGMTFSAIENVGNMSSISHLIPFVDRDKNLRELALKTIINIAEKEVRKTAKLSLENLRKNDR